MLKKNLVKYIDKIHLFDFYSNLRKSLTNSQVIVLTYHRIGPMKDNWIFNPLPLHQKIFEEHIKYLIKNFEIISINNLTKMIKDRNIPKKAVAITFDDGYKDHYKFALPVLKKYNIPATIFISSGPVDQKKLYWWDIVNYVLLNTDKDSILTNIGTYNLNTDKNKIKACFTIIQKLKKLDNVKKEYIMEDLINSADLNIPQKIIKDNILSWNEIKKMEKNKIEFGAHTVNHPILTNISIDEAKWEIINSKNRLEEMLGREITTFSYPNGDYNTKILEIVKNFGFNSSFTVKPGFINNSIDEIYKLNRINANHQDFYLFKLNFCGLKGDFPFLFEKLN